MTRTKFDGAFSMDTIMARLDEARDAHPTITRCANCRWKHRGNAAAGRQAFREHLTLKHPEVARRKRVKLVRGIRKSPRLDKAERWKREAA